MGLTRIKAEQISDIDYKQAVRAIQTTNVTLAGGAPSQVDGVNLMLNDRVLVTGQNTGSENGLYYVATLGTGSNGTWTRTSDANQTGEIEAGMIVMVTEGTTYADTQWKLTTNDPIVIGTTPLTFVINILSSVGGSNTQIQYNSAGTLGGSANLTWDGTSLAVIGAITATGNITSAGTIKGVNIDSTNADLAEHYQADSHYEPGTVVIFGGSQEITTSTDYADPRVAGVISTAPAHVMNSDAAGLPVALQGRVPCRVVGTVRKGDLMTTSDQPGVATRLEPADWQPGCVIGKSLADRDDAAPGVIEVAVGRL